MLTAVSGYYNGSQIVMDEAVDLAEGQRLNITILGSSYSSPKKTIDLKTYMGRGRKMLQTDANDYVRELRSNDRC